MGEIVNRVKNSSLITIDVSDFYDGRERINLEISDFLDNGFIDTFRYFNKTPHNYSWWSYRARCREKNLGWRIDYNFVSSSLLRNLSSADILSDVIHSDHCPVTLELID